MPDNSLIHQALIEIFDNHSFEKLAAFSKPATWKTLQKEDKEILAKLFVLQAEKKLKEHGKKRPLQQARKALTNATKLLPKEHKIWFKKAALLVERALIDSEFAHYDEIDQAFEKTLQLKNDFFNGWCAWGTYLIRRANIAEDGELLQAAQEKFEKAEELLKSQKLPKHEEAFFFWQRGFSSFMMGRFWGEAGDLHNAISYYRLAKELGMQKGDFFNDFANALVELGLLINQPEMLYEAIEYYLIAVDDKDVQSNIDLATRYYNLGASYSYLFESHHDEAYFKHAEDAFVHAHTLAPNFQPCIKRFANMLLYASKLWQDASLLEKCETVLHEALWMAESDPWVLVRYSEVLSHLGAQKDDPNLLTKAHDLANSAIEKDPNLIDAWCAYAQSLYSLGRYFSDEKHYAMSLDALEYALTLNPESGSVWYLLAIVKFAYAEIIGDITLLEESLASFHSAAGKEPSRFGYFFNDWGVALLHVADITHNKKFVEEAIEKFEHAVIAQDDVHPQWLVNFGSALDFYGDLTDDKNGYDKAIEVLQHAIELEPESTIARFHLALAFSHLGELESDIDALHKAITLFEEVISLDPEDENSYTELGIAYLHLANLTDDNIEQINAFFERAEKVLLQAQSLGSLSVFYNLACLYALKRLPEKSMHYLEKALKHQALPFVEDMLEDEWLDPVKDTDEFQAFIQAIMKEEASGLEE